MKRENVDAELLSRWEGAVAFRLFSAHNGPTLTVPEQIAAQVGERIIDERLAPGARIGEQALASEFQVSRSPVREAIRILEREGLVSINPRRGAFVTALSYREQRELFEVRGALLELVARLTAARRDPEFLVVLRAGIGRLDELARLADDDGRYADTTYRLVLIAARMCGNERAYRMLTAVSLQTLRYSKLGLATAARRRASVASWRRGYEALEQGDGETYVNLTRQRIDASGSEAARQLGEKSIFDPGQSVSRAKRGRASRNS